MENDNKDAIDTEDKDVENQDNKDEAGVSDDSKNKDDANKDDNKETKSGKTFTQEQVNKMMTREKNQGRNAVYKELGINPKDSKSIAMVKALIDSQKTDEEKQVEQESENQTKNH